MESIKIILDFETTGLHPQLGARPFAIGWKILGDDEVHIEIDKVDPKLRIPHLRPSWEFLNLLQDESVVKIGYNILFELAHCWWSRWETRGRWEDVMVMAYHLGHYKQSLKELSSHYGYSLSQDSEDNLKDTVTYLRKRLWKYYTLGDDWKGDMWISYNEGYDVVEEYLKQDILATEYLYNIFSERVADDPHYRLDMEMTLWSSGVETTGICVDTDELHRARSLLDGELTRAMKEYQEACMKALGWIPDPESPIQMVRAIYGDPPRGLGVPVTNKSPSGLPSTKLEDLEKVNHPITRLAVYIRSCRRYKKLYTENVEMYMVRKDGEYRVYPRFQPCGTITGRFSCVEPNIQQIANPDTHSGMEIPINPRRIFRPAAGCVWVGLDFKQMEARMAAVVSKEESLISSFMKDRDIFTDMVHAVWGRHNERGTIQQAIHSLDLHLPIPASKEVEEVWKRYGWTGSGPESTKEKIAREMLDQYNWDIMELEKALGREGGRGAMKTAFYAKLYGGSWTSCVSPDGSDAEMYKRLWSDIDTMYPNLYKMRQAIEAFSKMYDCVYTYYGRKIPTGGDPHKAVNYVIQGSCADMLKRSMARVIDYLRRRGAGRLVATIHDEIVVEIPTDQLDIQFLKGLAESCSPGEEEIPLPFPVDVSLYQRWDTPEKVVL